MDAFLRETPDTQRLYCEQASAQIGLPPASIEKDFWVCLSLREMFALPEWGPRFTFKGGTSLSKVWKLIRRFSEDVDIVIDRNFLGFGGERLGSKQKKRLTEECGRRIRGDLQPLLQARFKSLLPEGAAWSLTPDEAGPDRQTLLFQYPSRFSAPGRYVKPMVRIEMGARSETEPAENASIQPYLAEALAAFPAPNEFTVRTVTARRTFWEKAMLIHEELCRPTGNPPKERLSRHYYDLWCLITKGIGAQATADMPLFKREATNRQHFFRRSWMDYSTLARGSLRLVPSAEQLPDWRRDYAAMNEMFFGEAPTFDEIMKAVGEFERHFNQKGTDRSDS